MKKLYEEANTLMEYSTIDFEGEEEYQFTHGKPPRGRGSWALL